MTTTLKLKISNQIQSIAYSNHFRTLLIHNPIIAMAAEMAREMGRAFGVDVKFFFEHFVPLPKPVLRLFGATSNAAGRPLANLVELSASNYHYKVVVELPRVLFCENKVVWSVNQNSEVTLEGQITPVAIFAEKSRGMKRNRVRLCPNDPWAISFCLPGPVQKWTALVFFTSDNLMKLLVMRRTPAAKISPSRSIAFLPVSETSTTSSATFVPMAETSTSAFVLVAEDLASDLTAIVPETERPLSGSIDFVSTYGSIYSLYARD